MHEIVPPEQFGQDHWSTLLFVENIIVDHAGHLCPDDQRMRVWKYGAVKNYPTRLKGSKTIEHHDDWDCITDLIAAGILAERSIADGDKYFLTDYGWKVASQLRRWKADGLNISTFVCPVQITE